MHKLTLFALPLLALLAPGARADGHARQRAAVPAYAVAAPARVHHARSFGFSLYRSRAALAPAYSYAQPLAAPAYAAPVVQQQFYQQQFSAPAYAPPVQQPCPQQQAQQSYAPPVQQIIQQQSYAAPVQAPAPCYACQQQPAFAAPVYAAGGCGVSAGVRLRLGFGY